VELVDWTGRALHPKKKGVIAAEQPKILDRIGVDGEAFINYSTRFLKAFGSAVGAPSALIQEENKEENKRGKQKDTHFKLLGR